MAAPLRVVLISHSANGFAVAHQACTAKGHIPVVYIHARSMRPKGPIGPRFGESVAEIAGRMPREMDLLLPGTSEGLARALPGYRPDLIICNGFPWRLPESVLGVPRLGAVNIHPSLLPKYRGPIPIHWAIRNGDPETGVTVHWMDETFDTGHIIVQRGGVPIEDDLEPERLLSALDTLSGELLAIALERVAAGDPGRPQDESAASYAGWMEDSFSLIDWSQPARQIHNQVRTHRFGVPGHRGPLARTENGWIRVLRTRLTQPEEGSALRVECGDGPIWITEYESAEPEARLPAKNNETA